MKKETISSPQTFLNCFEIGKTYLTKMATKYQFVVEDILYLKKKNKQNQEELIRVHVLVGHYVDKPELTGCYLNPERIDLSNEGRG